MTPCDICRTSAETTARIYRRSRYAVDCRGIRFFARWTT